MSKVLMLMQRTNELHSDQILSNLHLQLTMHVCFLQYRPGYPWVSPPSAPTCTYPRPPWETLSATAPPAFTTRSPPVTIATNRPPMALWQVSGVKGACGIFGTEEGKTSNDQLVIYLWNLFQARSWSSSLCMWGLVAALFYIIIYGMSLHLQLYFLKISGMLYVVCAICKKNFHLYSTRSTSAVSFTHSHTHTCTH